MAHIKHKNAIPYSTMDFASKNRNAANETVISDKVLNCAIFLEFMKI